MFCHSENITRSFDLLSPYQVLVDGPSSKSKAAVPRHAISIANVTLTPIVIPKLPRAAGTGAVAKAWGKEGIEEKWDQSTWAKKRVQKERRQGLSDFERFKVMRLRKQVSYIMLRWGQVVQYRIFDRNTVCFLYEHALILINLGSLRGPKSSRKGARFS